MDWSGFEPEASGLQNRRSSADLPARDVPRVPRGHYRLPGAGPDGGTPAASTASQARSNLGTVGRRVISSGRTHSISECSQSMWTSTVGTRNRNGWTRYNLSPPRARTGGPVLTRVSWVRGMPVSSSISWIAWSSGLAASRNPETAAQAPRKLPTRSDRRSKRIRPSSRWRNAVTTSTRVTSSSRTVPADPSTTAASPGSRRPISVPATAGGPGGSGAPPGLGGSHQPGLRTRSPDLRGTDRSRGGPGCLPRSVPARRSGSPGRGRHGPDGRGGVRSRTVPSPRWHPGNGAPRRINLAGNCPFVELSAFSVVDAYPEGVGQGRDRYGELLALAETADRAGLSAFWVAEHHFHPGGLCPSPPVVLAAAGARTRRIRLGCLVCVLPFHAPVEVAETYGLLDELIGGRLNFG